MSKKEKKNGRTDPPIVRPSSLSILLKKSEHDYKRSNSLPKAKIWVEMEGYFSHFQNRAYLNLS